MAERLNNMVEKFLARVVDATNTEGYLHSDAKSIAQLESIGYIEVNRNQDMAGPKGEPAVRASQAGIDYFSQDFNETQGDDKMTEQTATTVKASTAVAGVEIPNATRAYASRTPKYPIDDLEEGQSFFVPATEKMPEPKKSLGSILTTARRRHGVETGEMVTNRKGDTVPELRYTRDFVLREVGPDCEIKDGSPWGEEFAGVSGAAIWRVPVED